MHQQLHPPAWTTGDGGPIWVAPQTEGAVEKPQGSHEGVRDFWGGGTSIYSNVAASWPSENTRRPFLASLPPRPRTPPPCLECLCPLPMNSNQSILFVVADSPLTHACRQPGIRKEHPLQQVRTHASRFPCPNMHALSERSRFESD